MGRDPIKHRRNSALWRVRHPERYEARAAQPMLCGFGRQAAPLHAHHHDYARQLDVTWVCHDCHGERHRSERRPT